MSAAASSLATPIQVLQFWQSDKLQSGAINMVKDLEGLYSNVLTIHVFTDDNLLEESLNSMCRKSHIAGYAINKHGFITDSLSVDTVGGMI